MIAYAIAAAMMLQSQPQSAERTGPPLQERFGAWNVRVTVDPVTDNVSIGAYLGTPADNLTIACAKDFPDSVIVVWRSTTRFRQTGYIPKAGEDVRLYRWPVSMATYRMDQDTPIDATIFQRQDARLELGPTDVASITSRIGTTTRLVLRDRLFESHTVVFDLVPADTMRALRRLDEVCGSSLGTPSAA